jgi:hypothetical protein
MADHPYRALPATAHWRRGVADVPLPEIDPVGDFKFKLAPSDKVASAGSCFAQHIARHLAAGGLLHYVAEPGHPLGTAETDRQFGYGMFSARYGNVYTSRQLLQLLLRALGEFTPQEPCWRAAGGGYLDPFRPTVEPDGFASREEMEADRAGHLGAVRRMFETLDVFVFTLGLTEYWRARADGAAFPLCPGVAGGAFEPSRYCFDNLSVAEVVDDMRRFRDRLLALNPRARIILTVSPVPLMATMAPRHVLLSNAASKAILRAAADQLEREHERVAYFPSYEIVTAGAARGCYFDPDLRSVTAEGVAHVMRLFLLHAAAQPEAGAARQPGLADADAAAQRLAHDTRRGVDAVCDENLL